MRPDNERLKEALMISPVGAAIVAIIVFYSWSALCVLAGWVARGWL